MGDIFVNDPRGSTLCALSSEDGTTVGELFAVIGTGALFKDGVLKASTNLVLTPGNYVFEPQGQRTQPVLDRTSVWVDAVSQPPTRHADYGDNNLLELANFLKAPPPTKAPVDQGTFDSWTTKVAETELSRYFQPVSGGAPSCQLLSIDVSGLLLRPMEITGENEDGYHGRLDQCVAQTLKVFAPEFKLRRNSSRDSSSCPLKRPDFTATIQGKGCFFRGEEKKLDSNEDPREELYSKLESTWPFPGLPFVLGYYAVGASITFCAVSKTDAQPLHELSFDLDRPQGRFRCWNTMRNVARVIRFWARTANTLSPNDLQDIEKSHSVQTDWTSKISFSGGHVLKQIHLRDDETQAKLDRLQAVLGILRSGKDGVQPIVSFKLSSSVEDRSKRRRIPPCLYVVTAFGVPMERVSSTEELKEIVLYLLKTVEQLHSLGITHRDIRLKNIVRNADGSYGLIDWDDSVRGLANLPNCEVSHLAKETHAPEMFVENGTHDRTVDLWSIGHLIHSSMEYADTTLTTLMDGLMAEAGRRMTVTEALHLLEG